MKKQSSRQFFNMISQTIYAAGTSYKFAKHVDLGSPKYRKGISTVLDWVGEVSYHFIQKEQHLQTEFDEIIHEKEKQLKSSLPPTAYKEGIIKGFEITRTTIQEIRKSKPVN